MASKGMLIRFSYGVNGTERGRKVRTSWKRNWNLHQNGALERGSNIARESVLLALSDLTLVFVWPEILLARGDSRLGNVVKLGGGCDFAHFYFSLLSCVSRIYAQLSNLDT